MSQLLGGFSGIPGNVRGWILGCNESTGSYAVKVVNQAINARVDRVRDAVPYNHLPFGSSHPGGAQFVLADGSVQWCPDAIDMTTYRALATAGGGEIASVP